ncbi:D-glycero-alpha-D-manno-heptose 7-phosphate kinase [Novipirellula aureliae]|uniref:D-glycero-alpha-D-manno-heptose 7-phosphate kinase n=1 Tax=Novipirellula aureliae TaxID=2527966 RepID=A0A5C6E0J9_9BACT|nr:bifunctional fucokinase/fucose-1-phosphate guanylyltransferase [Novipirellula aureliae]TWU41487.1 D-glycero-alpha-D-manno-heptose 7-phosphate kinase [Novipirellula aureliae]
MSLDPKLLLSLPPQMVSQLEICHPDVARRSFSTSDPAETQLGSGGGTAHVLHQAWLHSDSDSLSQWVADHRQIMIHGGGESRRLPAYAAAGKLFIPIPTLRWSRGQRLGQTLLDFNEPFLRSVFEQAGSKARLLIASGDVLLRSTRPLPNLPDADVVLLGMWADPEMAANFGVMFVEKAQPERLQTFLQKPDPDEIRDRSRDSAFLIDVGVWLLSARAIECLMTQCGWDAAEAKFDRSEHPHPCDLYGHWALRLGENPQAFDKTISELSVAVAPLSQGEFYHFGKTGDVIDSMYDLQTIVRDHTELGLVPSLAQPRQFVQDAHFGVPLRRQQNESLWVENCHVPACWSLSRRHMLTGVPENEWSLNLPEGICLDFVPIEDTQVAIRVYGFSDAFRGKISHLDTHWLERSAMQWFLDRGLDFDATEISADDDLQESALFPVFEIESLDGDFVQWMVDVDSSDQPTKQRSVWQKARKLSARELAHHARLDRVYAERLAKREAILPIMASHGNRSVFYNLDLAHVASTYANSDAAVPEYWDESEDLILAVHNRMFRSEVLRNRGDQAWLAEQAACFGLLERSIVEPYHSERVVPECRLAEDQIVWARSPARVDLAGGWTDTPPYCLEHGGSVVNIALDLNGQPPVQVFARRCEKPEITIRSIDLGSMETLTSYEEVGGFRGIGSGFSVAKAAVALAGFHPHFNGDAFVSLQRQLERFGGGLDVSMLAAIPKGSGLGTSSILAGTVLGALNELCSLGWDAHQIVARVSAVEQMLGSGGGWQDQFGGILPGAKLIQTTPGMSQAAAVRWLPSDFFRTPEFTSRSLLYYTGITRVAHNVLSEIVRGMFLNDPARLSVLDRIGENSLECFDAAQRSDMSVFNRSIRRSWELNQRLDEGTNPAEVSQLVERVESMCSSLKLSGAGGGGFLYMIARDAESAERIRRDLENDPPNAGARFVDMAISTTGLRVTRS